MSLLWGKVIESWIFLDFNNDQMIMYNKKRFLIVFDPKRIIEVLDRFHAMQLFFFWVGFHFLTQMQNFL